MNLIQDSKCRFKSFSIILKGSLAHLPQLASFNNGAQWLRLERGRNEPAISMALDRLQLRAVLPRNEHSAIARKSFSFRSNGQSVAPYEVRHRLGPKRNDILPSWAVS